MEAIKKRYMAKIEELQDLLDLLEGLLGERGATMKNIMNINVAVEEIFVNVASYAYEGMENKGVEITIDFEDNDVIVLEFADYGIPFNPLEKTDPDVTASIDERGVGGLGIYMVKKSMDSCEYKREDGKNIFTFKKKYK